MEELGAVIASRLGPLTGPVSLGRALREFSLVLSWKLSFRETPRSCRQRRTTAANQPVVRTQDPLVESKGLGAKFQQVLHQGYCPASLLREKPLL